MSSGKRVADVGTDIDMIDVKHRQFGEARFDQKHQGFGGDLIARLGKDFTGCRIVEIGGNILAMEVIVLRAQEFDAPLRQASARCVR